MGRRATALGLLAVLSGLTACAHFDSGPPLLPLLQANQSTGVTGPSWWDSSYAHRRKIVFGTQHSALALGHTVALSLDTQTTTNGPLLATGDDVRIVWHPSSGTASELDRIGTIWNSASTSIEFRLQSAIDANLNEDTDGSYYVYYRNASAGTPPTAEANVYYFADFFNRSDSTSVAGGWTEWTANGGNAAIVSNRLELAGTDVAFDSGVKQDFSLGAIPGNFTLSFDWRVVGIVQGTWTQFVNIGDSTMSDTAMETGVALGLYFGEGGGITPDVLYNMDNDFSAAGQIENSVIADGSAYTTWSILLTVDTTAKTFTYSRDGTTVGGAHAFADSSVTSLGQIRIGLWNWAAALSPYGYDNLKIKLTVSDDPEVSVEAVESI